MESEEDVRLALSAGADALGFVGPMPDGPGVVDEDRIAQLIAGLPAGADSFLLSSEVEGAALADQARRCRPATLQICDRPRPGACAALRRALPDLRLVQVIHVVNEASLDEAAAAASQVDALLLDSGNPDAAEPSLGGTGRVHDWSLSRRIVEASPVPVWLAGGLNPGNVAEAVAAVGPLAAFLEALPSEGGGSDR